MGTTIILLIVLLLVCLFRNGIKTILEFLCLGLLLWLGFKLLCWLLSLLGIGLSFWGVISVIIILLILCVLFRD